MSFHHRHRRIRFSALALACCALAVPASASAQKIGDTPADFGQPVAAAPRGGDTPADFPGASRAPQYEPPQTISIVRPERTVVHDADELLPILLSAGALLLAACGVGIALVRTDRAPRSVRTH